MGQRKTSGMSVRTDEGRRKSDLTYQIRRGDRRDEILKTYCGFSANVPERRDISRKRNNEDSSSLRALSPFNAFQVQLNFHHMLMLSMPFRLRSVHNCH